MIRASWSHDLSLYLLKEKEAQTDEYNWIKDLSLIKSVYRKKESAMLKKSLLSQFIVF